MLAPILKEVKAALGDRIKLLKIDVDSNAEIAGRYQIRGVPTMILFKKGEIQWRKSGVLPKNEILNEIEAYL
jgi:thioredoxin 1